jgi:hypothetical protein
MAGYTARHMRTLRKLPDFPGELVNPGACHPRYRDTPELREWCAETLAKKKLGVPFLLAPLQRPNLFSRLARFKTLFFADLEKEDPVREWDPPSLIQILPLLNRFVDLRDSIQREIKRRNRCGEMNYFFE